jgi:N-acetylglucosaminyl-diphospho-decaprenol L-rhamnosyltransferase
VSFSVVIVLHDSEPELDVLLDSVRAHLLERPQLVVVDSGSRDGGAALARVHGAEVVDLPGNPGFGAACNAGLERVRHNVTVLLNPDCELLDPALALLAGAARERPRALHAPRLLNPDGTVQRSAHPLPGTPGTLIPAVSPWLPWEVRVRAEPYFALQPRTVGWAIAACLAASTATLRQLGPFDPGVHLFAEDMELCLRARAAGIPTILHPELRIRHAGGHAVLRDGEPYEAIARRRREAIAATRGAPALAVDDLGQALTFAGRAVAHGVIGGNARRPWAQLAALRRARKPVGAATPPVSGGP